MPQQAKVFDGRYRLVKHLGSGAFGDAFLVEHTEEKIQYVIKSSKGQGTNSHVLDETQNMSVTTSDHVVRCYRSWIDSCDKRCYMLLEYCDGGDLEQYITRSFPLSELHLVSLFAQLLLGLDHIHTKHLLHRDIKLQNIMLQSASGMVKIGDFGLSKSLNFTDEMRSTRLGTPLYFSPEVMSGRQYTRKTDVWSMGVAFYRLMTNQLPFKASDVSKLYHCITKTEPVHPCHITPGYSQQLGEMVLRMLTKSRTNRPNARELLALPLFSGVLKEWPWRQPRFKGTTCIFVCRPRASVNVRAKPSLSAELLGAVQYGDQIYVHNDYICKENLSWYRVLYPIEGYCIVALSDNQHLFQRVDDPARYSPIASPV